MPGADTGSPGRWQTREGLCWLEPAEPLLPGVRVAVATRAGGISTGSRAALNLASHVGDDPEHVAENRRRLRQALALQREPFWLQQVHGIAVADADQSVAGPPMADAAVTRGDGVLAILTADCLPVAFAVPRRNAAADEPVLLGAAHAGWRGLLGGVLETTLGQLEAAGGTLSEAVAWLGPAIGPAAFEVGEEVREAFVGMSAAAAAAFVRNERGRWQADLFLLARQRLAQAGVAVVGGGGVCTCSDAERWFSYRRDAQPGRDTGRLATVVWQERVNL